ncbi:MAG: histidine--tRNA ligase [Sulfolobales archaeon]|nr:histidine--tRNA ligase [Sulfolobales archaeon]MDW8082608.1 histidine--tRNA ligase [Sulfolobales archaeon]
MKIPLEPARGTRDILPPHSEYYQQVVSRFSEIAELYGYRLAVIPTIEHFEIYEAKSGPGISRSMYVFQDKAGRTMCLRPEFTASIVRAYLKHLIARPKPVKLYYYGQVFRYDEPQFGRYREFYQVGVEYIGEPRIYADIELFQLVRDFYRSIGLSNYSFRVNDISIIRGLLSKWKLSEEAQDEVLHLIDKGEIEKALNSVSSYAGSEKYILEELLETKALTIEDLRHVHRKLGSLTEVVASGFSRLIELFEALLKLGFRVYVDFRLVRGLAYYTGIIFEITVPEFNLSIGGGGRYDTLSQLLSGIETPATGFSLGVERTVLALEAEKALENLSKPRPRVMLVSIIPDVAFVDRVSTKMRDSGVVVDVRFTYKQKLSDLLSQAVRLGYDFIAIVGESELKEQKVAVKYLKTGTQKTVDVDAVDRLIFESYGTASKQ